MAFKKALSSTLIAALLFGVQVNATTCPGFPGYCSESFPGQTCAVVCSRGRNNVPLCQDDGTWTDIPRCIEHDPGVPNQVPGFCPGISGYCSDGYLGQQCNFACSVGPSINSICTEDGTWTPYPTCAGDLRETQDGCLSCPGPNGRPRNRTAEAVLGLKLHNPVPSSAASSPSTDAQGRPVRPTFSGNQAFGSVSQPQGQQQFVPNLEAAGLRPTPQMPPQQPFQPQQQQPPVFRPQQQPPVFQPQQQQPPVFQPQQQPQGFQPQQQQPPFFQPQQQQQQPPVFQQQQQQPSGFSPEQRRIIEQGIARVEGFPQQQQQFQQPRQLQQPQQPAAAAPPPPLPRGPRPEAPVFPSPGEQRFGPFEVVQPPEENSVDTGPLPSFPAIPGGNIGDAPSPASSKARERPSAFGPFQLVDL